jgi:hypothetical protein
VPAGLFLILKGTCEILHGGAGADADAGGGAASGPGPSCSGARGGGAAADFADRLSDSDDYEEEDDESEEQQEEGEGRGGERAGGTGGAPPEWLEEEVVALDLGQSAGGKVGGSGARAAAWAGQGAPPSSGLFGRSLSGAFGGDDGGGGGGGLDPLCQRRRRLSMAHVSKLIGRMTGAPPLGAGSALPAPLAATLGGGGGVLGVGVASVLPPAGALAPNSASLDGSSGPGSVGGRRPGHRRAASTGLSFGGDRVSRVGSSLVSWGTGRMQPRDACFAPRTCSQPLAPSPLHQRA